LMRHCSLISPGRSTRSPFSTWLQLVLHQDSSNRIWFGLRIDVPDDLSGYATRPLFTRRLCDSRPSPHWRRTWIACSRLKMTAPTTTWKLLARIMLQLLRLHEDARWPTNDCFDYSSRLQN
jgi:hypothetical protein